MTEEEYRADVAARASLTQQTLTVSQGTPTPTQQENDLLRLGLMHPDEKADPDNAEMPPTGLQEVFLAKAVADAGSASRSTGARRASATPSARP